jgi:hypothetical protein
MAQGDYVMFHSRYSNPDGSALLSLTLCPSTMVCSRSIGT